MAGGREARKYSAFISYRHHSIDRFQAIRLMKAIEGFGVPKTLRKEGYPAKLDPVFRDDDEANAGTTLSEQLQQALTNARVLIVICTSRTKESQWVRREIEFFIGLGRRDRIIPVLIEGEPKDVMPDALRASGDGWGSTETLAVDLRPKDDEKPAVSLHRAVLRIAAAALECHYDDLAQRALAEQRRRRTTLAAGGTVFCALAGVTGFFVWDGVFREKDSYFASEVERWSAPVGIHPLSMEEVRHRSASVRLTTKAGRVIAMATVGGAGNLRADENGLDIDEPWAKNAALTRYFYASDGALESVAIYNEDGGLLRRLRYDFGADRRQSVFRVENGVGHAETFIGNATEASARGDDGDDARGNGFAPVGHSDVGQHRLFYDASGLAIRETFEDLTGAPTPDANGIAGFAYAYNSLGQKTEARELDTGGNVVRGRSGIASAIYNERGEEIGEEFRNANGVLANGPDGFARGVVTRDARGNITRVQFFDANGAPTLANSMLIAEVRLTYDDQGDATDQAYYGVHGEPAYSRSSYVSEIRSRYDAFGRMVELSNFCAGQPCLQADEGVAAAQFAYRQQVKTTTFLGLDHRPTPVNGSGASAIVETSDAQGNVIEVQFRDENGRPMAAQDGGGAVIRREYDDQGRLTHERYLGVDGAPASHNGTFGSDFIYDRRSNLLETDDVDAVGHVAMRHRRTYNTAGLMIDAADSDAAGRAAVDPRRGASSVRLTYDDRGRILSQAFFGVNGEESARGGIHEMDYAYGDDGHSRRETDLGIGGVGLGQMRFVDDNQGRNLEASAWLLDGAPATTHYLHGVHMIRQTYGGPGGPVRREFLGVNGLPTLDDEGIASTRLTYDVRGNVVREDFFGVFGEPGNYSRDGAPGGPSSMTHQLDSHGRETETDYYSQSGVISLKTVWRYDRFGHLIELTDLLPNGQPSTNGRGVYQTRFSYDANGQCQGSTSIGVGGVTIAVGPSC